MSEGISVKDLERMLLDPSVPESDLRPYIEVDEMDSRAFAPQLRVKSVAVKEAPEEAALILGSLNGISRWRRQVRYRQRIEEDPSLIRIVSEGDSWFQYPFLLDDVIDQIFDRYAIFSLGAAGDLLGDMLRQDEAVAAIDREQARLFLISGGGNDLLGGGRLQTYLRPFEPDRDPVDYLDENFEPFLANIIQLYRDLFARVTQSFPDLRALCHGYDHAVPEGGRWLGRPMEKLGIEERTLQRAIIRVIVERFNAELQGLEAEFPGQVFYVDCRGAVADDQWHDELHPTDAGYGSAAERFVAKIMDLTG